MDDHKGNKIQKYFIAISIALVVLNIIRIFKVPVTHDEAITVVDYSTLAFENIVGMLPPSANNHILNTLLTNYFTTIFSYDIFFVRLPNLLAQVLFLFFSARICLKLFTGNTVAAILTFTLLSIDPFVFEFWGLCRGYGLSLAFLMGSVFHILNWTGNRKLRSLIYSLLFSMAAVYANLSLLNYFLALLALIAYTELFSGPVNRKSLFISAATAAGATFILGLIIALPINRLLWANELYYGGTEGFVPDTIRSLVNSTLQTGEKFDSPLIRVLSYGMAAILVAISVYTVVLIFKKEKRNETKIHQVALNLLLLLPALSVILQFHLLDTKYIVNRTAIFFIPLFILSLSFFLSTIKGKIGTAALSAIAVAALINFTIHITLDRSWLWWYDRYEQVVMEKIVRDNAANAKKISIRPFWLYAPSMQYYAMAYYHGKFDTIIHTKDDIDTDTSYDYYFVNKRHLGMLSAGYTVDTIYENEYYLMKKVK